VYNKFYGNDGVSINPGGGQVFFEIDFKEAIDYKSGGQNIATKDGGGVTGAPGTMSINSSILFWKDPKSISKLVKGISYSLTRCKNTFSGGVFKQTLYANLNTFGDSGSNDDGKAREKPAQRTGSGPNKGNSNATTNKNGWKNPDLFEASKRYSNDPKIRKDAWNKELAKRDAAKTAASNKAFNQALNKGTPPLLKRNSPPET
jgi:hypothetical protein